jgi:POT family proton-dependent oligopeptide transporter
MLRGHPRALAFIFFTEMWERVGFYTLMAVLVLYMDRVLGWSDSRKGDWYGLFLALCYFVPLVGGWLGDRVFGRLRTVRAGAVLMAAGYAGLAVSSASQVASFIAGLFLIALGTGVFKVNMSVLVGNLYREKPELRDAGFNIFYMGVNLGAMVAPLIATLNSAVFHSYNISFWVSAAGLVFALAVFHAGRRHLAPVDDGAVARAAVTDGGKEALEQGATSHGRAEGTDGSSRASGTANEAAGRSRGDGPRADDGARVATLVILFLIIVFFWVAFYQNGFGLTLFAARSTVVLNWLRPETYQFFEPFFILVLTPLLLALFDRLRRREREPSTPRKILLGLAVMTLSMFVMVMASLAGGDKDLNIMSPAWLIGTYFLVTVAEILISPMGQSFVSKVAPARLRGLMMGGWFAAIAAGSYGSGLLGKFYSSFPHHQFFIILAAILAFSALLILTFMRRLERFAG